MSRPSLPNELSTFEFDVKSELAGLISSNPV